MALQRAEKEGIDAYHMSAKKFGSEEALAQKILDVLAEQKVPAAFFLVGTYMEENSELVKRMAKEGHIVGNHTMNHPDMSKIVELTAFKKEITEVEALYEKINGKKMKKFYYQIG